MIYLFYTRCNDELTFDYADLFSEYRKSRLAAIKNSAACRQSAAAELLLNYAARQLESDIKLPLDIPVTSGRPVLRGGEFSFSISHSDDIVACAVSDENIGLDVQVEREYKPSLAKRFFSEAENDIYNHCADRDKMFFKLWSMKESYVKAMGKGINYGFNSFTVDIGKNRLSDGGASFWHKKLDGCHYALCSLEKSCCRPDKFEYIDIKELL